MRNGYKITDNSSLPVRRNGRLRHILPVFMAVIAAMTSASASFAGAEGQIPMTFAEFTGFTPEERIAENYQVVQYLQYLDRVSDRVSAFEIGYTYNRQLQMGAIVTSPENHARIEQIRQNALLLSDPRGLSTRDAESIIAQQPAILYLGGSIHGFELSGTEGVLMLLSDMVTQNDDAILERLKHTVLIFDPIINADGRDAFARRNHDHTGRVHNPDPVDWANDFNSWDGVRYRTSHYFFDLNRDWFAHTHPEARSRAALFQHWRIQAGVDAHEMGPNTEFYVDPPIPPGSPYYPQYTLDWYEKFGRVHADAFDEHHVEYTKREIFNFFYPAYMTAYMSFQGAVGMLYEQGSSRGFALSRSDGTVRTLNDASRQQYIALNAAVDLATTERERMLRDYLQSNRDAVDKTGSGAARYIITPKGDPHLVAETVNMLMRSGIEIHHLEESVRLRNVIDRTGAEIGRHTIPSGSFIIEAAQPRQNFIRILMEPNVPLPDDFLKEARQRLDRGANPRFYETTSWSIPLLYNLEAYNTTDNSSLTVTPLSEPVKPLTADVTAESLPVAHYAYLIDGSQAKALSAIHPLREAGIRVTVLFKPTRMQGKDYPSGSVIVRTDGNHEEVHQKVHELAQRFHLRVHALDSGRSDPGYPPLGSIEGRRITKPEIALIGNHPIHGYSFGWAWHTLDRHYEIPHTVINAATIGSIPLERFNVIILPAVINAGLLETMLDESGMERLKRWVRDGGTLVTIGTGADFVRSRLEMISLESWYEREENEKQQRVSVPGAFFKGSFDPENWLTSGYIMMPPLMINSNRVMVSLEGPPSTARNAAISVSDRHLAGHAWEENLQRLPESVFLYEEKHGRGRVIAFTEDVNFRGYWRGVDRLFLNAVILGPSAP